MPSFQLHPDVVFDGARLVDSLTGHDHIVSPLAMQVLWLDSEITGDEAIAHVARANDVRRSEIERELRQLLLLGLLEGSCSSAREQMRHLRRGGDLEERVLPGSRLGCCGSGACCRGWGFGPVSEEERAQIESLPLRARLPYIGDGPWFQPMRGNAGKPAYRLSTRGEACVFLDEHSRCGLHSAFGSHAKPAFCQLFPISSVATIDGLKIFDRCECASFSTSVQNGTPIEEHLPAVRHLLPQELYHPRVMLEGGWHCDYSLILSLARRLDMDLGSMPSGPALQAIGQRIRRFMAALTQCSLVHGQPEFAASSELQMPIIKLTFALSHEGDAAPGLRYFAELARALAANLPRNAWLVNELDRIAADVERAAVTSSECSEQGRSKAGGAPHVPDAVDSALLFSLRHQIFGHELLLDGSLPGGLLRMICITVLSRQLARLRAYREGRAIVSALDLGICHMHVKRALNHPALRECLVARTEHVWAILAGLPALWLAAAT